MAFINEDAERRRAVREAARLEYERSHPMSARTRRLMAPETRNIVGEPERRPMAQPDLSMLTIIQAPSEPMEWEPSTIAPVPADRDVFYDALEEQSGAPRRQRRQVALEEQPGAPPLENNITWTQQGQTFSLPAPAYYGAVFTNYVPQTYDALEEQPGAPPRNIRTRWSNTWTQHFGGVPGTINGRPVVPVAPMPGGTAEELRKVLARYHTRRGETIAHVGPQMFGDHTVASDLGVIHDAPVAIVAPQRRNYLPQNWARNLELDDIYQIIQTSIPQLVPYLPDIDLPNLFGNLRRDAIREQRPHFARLYEAIQQHQNGTLPTIDYRNPGATMLPVHHPNPEEPAPAGFLPPVFEAQRQANHLGVQALMAQQPFVFNPQEFHNE